MQCLYQRTLLSSPPLFSSFLFIPLIPSRSHFSHHLTSTPPQRSQGAVSAIPLDTFTYPNSPSIPFIQSHPIPTHHPISTQLHPTLPHATRFHNVPPRRHLLHNLHPLRPTNRILALRTRRHPDRLRDDRVLGQQRIRDLTHRLAVPELQDPDETGAECAPRAGRR